MAVETLNPGAAKELADARPGLRVTIYLPVPKKPGFDEIREFDSSCEHAAREVERRLDELGVDREAAEGILGGLRGLDVEMAGLPPRTRAVGIFHDPSGTRVLALNREHVPHTVYIGRSHALRPLLRAERTEGTFRVLALSNGAVGLFEGDARGLTAADRGDVPASLVEALGSELTESVLQSHSTATGGTKPTFHGQGGADKGREVDQERFHMRVAGALRRLWARRSDPLVLAADASHQGRFRKVCDLPGLLEEGVIGSPERMSEETLFELARPLVVGSILDDEGRRLREALGEGHRVTELERAAAAAVAARVDCLWVDSSAQRPKHIDPSSGDLVDAFGDEDAYEELAGLVLGAGGRVVPHRDGELGEAPELVASLRG